MASGAQWNHLDLGDLAAELHDRVIADLTSLILEMEQFKREQYNREGVRQAVAAFQSSTRSALSQLRDVVHGIQGAPADLECGFVEAVRSGSLVELGERTGACARIVSSPRWPARLDSLTAIQLYRIIEQALRNVADHSGARNVSVVLQVSGDNLVVEVADDGIGFPSLHRMNGQGMTGMEQRALILGGALEIANKAPQGSIVRVTVPR